MTEVNRKDKQQIFKQIDELIQNIKSRLHRSMLLLSHKKLPLLPQPTKLKGGQLKDYQLQSLAWMVELANNNLSGILADDMGLGKTIQAIAYLSYIEETKGVKGKHLIVVPKNVLNNWMRELRTWNPIFKVVVLPGTEVEREECINKYIKTSNFDILIATFQSVQSAENRLKRFNWETLIVDEAHSIKNDQTMIACCLRRLTSKFCLLLTGTPLSNQLKQLWSLLNFIVPDIFKDSQLFRQIEESVNMDSKNEEEKIKYQSEVAAKFKAIISPFLLRRVKGEINLGLKEKKQFTLFISLSEIQLKMYRNFLKYNTVYGEGNGYQEGKPTQLRKICAHPYLFSDIEDPNAPPYGDHLIDSCGKMKLLDKLLSKLLREKHKILIFSQFVIFLKILEDYCSYRGHKYSKITGESSLDDRDKQVDQFSNSIDVNIFLISTRAGGLGLNLVAADVVILYDLDWNPQMDKQATDRAYRIGQKNSVKVFKLITLNTIEQRILEVQKYKLIWDELVIQKGGLAKIKAAQEGLEKIDHNKLAGLGAEEIFKLQQNFDENTIDEIIRMGQEKDKQKTQQIRNKLEKELKAYNNDVKNPFENLFEVETDLKDIDYEAQAVGNRKTKQKKFKERKNEARLKQYKYIQPKSYYLFDDIQTAGELLYQLKKIDSESEDNDQKLEINKKLNELGFFNWKLKEYEKFVQANKLYSSNDYAKIADHIKSKSIREVEAYSNRFFQKAENGGPLFKDLKKIKAEQEKISKKKQLEELEEKIKKIPEELFNMKGRPVHVLEISKEAVIRMHYNGIKENGICLDEYRELFSVLNSKCVDKVNKQFATTISKIANYKRAIGYYENRQQQTEEQLYKRYQYLRNQYCSTTTSKPKQEKGKGKNKVKAIEDEDSAKTEVKGIKV